MVMMVTPRFPIVPTQRTAALDALGYQDTGAVVNPLKSIWKFCFCKIIFFFRRTGFLVTRRLAVTNCHCNVFGPQCSDLKHEAIGSVVIRAFSNTL